MAVDGERVEAVEGVLSCDPGGLVFDDDGTLRRTTPCLCLPETDALAGWLECASCGLRQAPGKEWCGFCGRRWVSAP